MKEIDEYTSCLDNLLNHVNYNSKEIYRIKILKDKWSLLTHNDEDFVIIYYNKTIQFIKQCLNNLPIYNSVFAPKIKQKYIGKHLTLIILNETMYFLYNENKIDYT